MPSMNPPPKSSIIMWSLIVLMLIFVALSIVLRRAEEPLETPEEKPVSVRLMRVSPQRVVDRIELPGRIVADARAQLAVDKGGRITAIHVDKGDAVAKGDLLLQIDDRLWQAFLERAEIEWREAERDFKRWTELMATGSVSASDFDAVQARYDRAHAQLQEAKVHVEQCSVFSPGDGVINARHVEVGEFAAEGAAVFEWLVMDPVRLRLDVPERDIGSISLGASIPFRVGALLSDDTFTGMVSHVALAATANQSYRVDARLPNPEGLLRPGMIATAHIERDRREDAIVVPLSAVLPRQGEHFVFVKQDGRGVRRLVRLDRILGDEVVLASGLSEGEDIVIEGHRELADGAMIEAVTEMNEE